ncbi:MAG: replication-associated recombination protein A [Bdellovibrionaceae bacterium]|jgi:putative ATPase|nr:replication-associated recombination protein A [Pseudobdellovibrionaceae bacterium]
MFVYIAGMDLFEAASDRKSDMGASAVHRPLADLLRPANASDFYGQYAAFGDLKKFIEQYNTSPVNLILWGPPGSGKTSFAHLLESHLKEVHFISSNAIDLGSKKIREIGEKAHREKLEFQRMTVLFIDEIHRLNKSQQDMLLPFTESGDFSLIGATTESPSYEINSALLSRCRVLVFDPLDEGSLGRILEKAFRLRGIEVSKVLSQEATKHLCEVASGDARRVLNFLEIIFEEYHAGKVQLGLNDLTNIFKASPVYYDKKSQNHYDCISAFIKSVRGSDPDAALYYLARMIEGGEDPAFICRRLIILASEDVGNADPKALTLAVSGLEGVKAIGFPEARILLSQVTSYLACAPKSNAAYVAINKAQKYVKNTGAIPIPIKLSSSQGHIRQTNEVYKYSHDYNKSYVKQSYLPERVEKDLQTDEFYSPKKIGYEKHMLEYMKWLGKKE